MTQTAEVCSTSRCKRYQRVAGMDCLPASNRKSSITSGRLPSRNIRSAAFKASSAAWQRTHSSRDSTLSSICSTSSESLPSMNATMVLPGLLQQRPYQSRTARISCAGDDFRQGPLGQATLQRFINLRQPGRPQFIGRHGRFIQLHSQSRKFFREQRSQLDDIGRRHNRASTCTPASAMTQRKIVSPAQKILTSPILPNHPGQRLSNRS